ncbi:UvrD-helicase domain-containing protein [Vallitalea maricola]|uniref:Uncharacterized protein n=1 Tax=Vallitalea maricola TaxID=3074433 RepID=A0ACB5UNG1_9FIRM|nr:hypothetical protein AN2V17_33990 [Vallitalea sp. AN17-2]
MGNSLDSQQRQAIVVDEKSNLVVAGAGSGKTLTISGKVKYLVDRKGIEPNNILLISYTRKAADEMKERIVKKLNVDVQSLTFHALGVKIIREVEKKPPIIFDEFIDGNPFNKFFKEEIYKSREYVNKIIEFYGLYINVPKEVNEFETIGDYYEYCKSVDFTTLKGKMSKDTYVKNKVKELREDKMTIQGEQVKSFEELMIANFLYLNGINYEYEKLYEYDTADQYHRQYKPDFYLTDYDIYLEHFGINKEGKAPWLNSIEEQRYLEGMIWKRRLHIEKGTKLIETYSYYNQKGILLKLKEILVNEGVSLIPIDYYKVFSCLYNQKEDRYFKELIKLFKTFVKLFKSNGYKLEKFNQYKTNALNNNNRILKQRTILFMDIAERLFTYYENYLTSIKKIDFDDMINKSTEYVRAGKWMLNYKYQDISVSRYKLIKKIRDKVSAKVLCVGDDWQSIYRFAGSEINLFKEFDKFFGYYEMMKIEKTYRNSQELINIAGNFIMNNSSQFTKDLKSDQHNPNPLKIYGYVNHQ